jgi:SAM-dependent methyltransferase
VRLAARRSSAVTGPMTERAGTHADRPPTPSGEYTAFDSGWQEERQRLGLQEQWLDPWSTRQLDELAVAGGWSCLEVGAGGGSIADWLCTRVGAQGHVLATDIDTRFVDGLRHPNLEVQQLDISADGLPSGRFDVVHARLLLSHLSTPDVAMTHLIEALKPGGWLLVEDYAHITLESVDHSQDPDRSRLWRAALTLSLQYMQARGITLDMGGQLYGMFRSRGLLDVHAEGRVSMECGGSIYTDALAYGMRRFSAAGALASLGPDALDRVLALLGDPEFGFMSQVFMSVRGHKPG